MSGNSFATPDGAHVTGAVAMALDDAGNAVPIEADTPIGTVKLDLEELCRALAAHACIIAGKGDMEETAQAILNFAKSRPSAPSQEDVR